MRHLPVRLAILSALLAAPLAGCRNASQLPAFGRGPDGVFLSESAKAFLGEAELSRAALDRAQDPRVKEFARKVLEEQSALDADLRAAGQKLALEVPARVDSDQERVIRGLASRRGEDFDRSYVACMAADLRSTVAAFSDKAHAAEHPEVGALAQKHLPALESLLGTAQDLERAVGAPRPGPVVPPPTPGAPIQAGKTIG